MCQIGNALIEKNGKRLISKPLQGITGNPIDRPFIHRHSPKASIKLNGWRIPIQNPPLKTAITLLVTDFGKMLQ